ncbi:MAG: hypothetical protein ACI4XI_05855 [Ruminococcus sp.]
MSYKVFAVAIVNICLYKVLSDFEGTVLSSLSKSQLILFILFSVCYKALQ